MGGCGGCQGEGHQGRDVVLTCLPGQCVASSMTS